MHDDVEVLFCDLCGTSVAVGDLAAGAAVRHQGKLVGGCCLPALRGVPSPPRSTAAPAAIDARGLVALVVVLAAIAAATLYLDHRATTAWGATDDQQARLLEAQSSDSQVLAAVAVALDGVPRRAEIEDLAAQVRELAASTAEARAALRAEVAALGNDLAAVAAAVRTLGNQAVDYRPLFEDLRQRQVRLLDAVSSWRAATPSAVAEPAPAVPPPAEATPAPGLPPALAEHVRRLGAADPATRFEAVDELIRSKDAAVLPHLLPMAKDADPFVRRLTVEGLAEWRRPEVVEVLLAAMADADEYVRDTAWRSLREVSGQKIPFDTAASKEARARAVQKWQEWWDKNKAAFGS
jgi:hypothetical protein